MKKFIIACFILFPIVCFAKDNKKEQCIKDCGEELGICMNDCAGDAKCISRCQAAHGRCITRCKK